MAVQNNLIFAYFNGKPLALMTAVAPPVGEPLTAPTITIDGDILTITATDERAESFAIIVDGVEREIITGTTFDLSTLNLSAGEHVIFVTARANGYAGSAPSNSVYYKANADMTIEDIYVSSEDRVFANTFAHYTPTAVETDKNGDTVFYFKTLALKIVVTGITDAVALTQPLYLKEGQRITIYPFYMESPLYEDAKEWKYKIVIPEDTKGAIFYNGGTMLWGMGAIYWGYAPIAIELTFDDTTGIGKITAIDCDGDGSNTGFTVDVTQGITIEAYKSTGTPKKVKSQKEGG